MSRVSKVFPVGFKEYIEAKVIWRSLKELTVLINDHFGTNFSERQIKHYKHNHRLSSGLTGRFEKGHVPTNGFPKGHYPVNAFPRGHKPWNHVDVGTEVFKDDGYLWRKIALPNKWKQVHVILWEKHNGKRPKGMKIIFLDGNKQNITIENLALLKNAEMLILNKRGLINSNPEFTKVGVTLAKVIHKTHQLEKGE